MDLDNDGIKDLFFGQPNGRLTHYKGKGHLIFDPVGTEGDLQVNSKDFTMYYYAFPEIVDWNDDGLWDLIAHGKHNWDDAPNLLVFINEGTAGQYVFSKELQYQNEGGIGFPYIEPRVVPTVADLDYDGKKDIILGAANGEIHFYSNQGTNSAPLFDFDSKVVLTNDSGKYWTTVLPEVKPDIADLNGDGRLDIITGGCGNGKGEGGGSELDVYISYGYGDVGNNKIIKNSASLHNEKLFEIKVMNGKCHIANESDNDVSVSLYNLRGLEIVKKQKLSSKKSVVFTNLTIGNFYIAKIMNSEFVVSKKVLITK